MDKQYLKSVSIIAPVFLLLVWMVYFFTYELDYEWHWERVQSYLVIKDSADVLTEFDGFIKRITVKNQNATIEVVGNNREGNYTVTANSVDVEEDEWVYEDQKLGTIGKTGLLLKGIGTTLLASFLAILFSYFVSLFLFFIYLKNIPYVNLLIYAFSRIVKGVPLIWQIPVGYFFFSFFLDYVLSFVTDFSLPRLGVGIIVLSINSGVAITCILINTDRDNLPPNGRFKSESLSVFCARIPDVVSESVNTIKDSSLLSIIAISELTKVAKKVIYSTYATFEMMIICCVTYIIIVHLFIATCDFLMNMWSYERHEKRRKW